MLVVGKVCGFYRILAIIALRLNTRMLLATLSMPFQIEEAAAAFAGAQLLHLLLEILHQKNVALVR
jgi:hypothetical protein